MQLIKDKIEKNWNNKNLWNSENLRNNVFKIIDNLDKGILRIAFFKKKKWFINEWIKKAILMYFYIKNVEKIEIGPFEFCDKIPLKKGYKKKGIRVTLGAIARYGSYISPGVILMPSYINIGSYLGKDTMVDTWATIGSCAQIGNRVHISGGVGIGGVLEPLQSYPVIIEDDVFIGSRCIIVEGVHIKKGAVLGANVVLTSSTRIIDVTKKIPKEFKGSIPKNSVVIPGNFPKKFPSGIYYTPCSLIIGKRKESTNIKTSLNEILRKYDISI
jgi:2,3,4,5-tetrahydropyridine-2-carboxylate N-succinyltransferase